MNRGNTATAAVLALAILCGLVALAGVRGERARKPPGAMEMTGAGVQLACPRLSLL
jgi:hypothetical protein